jgi:O-antigen/teichoic acid export membrane protein
LVSATLGTVVVSGLSDVVTTNAYAAMERLFNLAASVIVALYMAAYPRLAASFYESRRRYWVQVWQYLRLGGLLGLAVMGVFFLFGEVLLRLYISAPLAAKVMPVMWAFAAWLGLYLTQHVLSGYFVFAQRNGLVLAVNAAVLLVTACVGYPLATLDPVLWVFGMLAGQALAVVWLWCLYHRDKQF